MRTDSWLKRLPPGDSLAAVAVGSSFVASLSSQRQEDSGCLGTFVEALLLRHRQTPSPPVLCYLPRPPRSVLRRLHRTLRVFTLSGLCIYAGETCGSPVALAANEQQLFVVTLVHSGGASGFLFEGIFLHVHPPPSDACSPFAVPLAVAERAATQTPADALASPEVDLLHRGKEARVSLREKDARKTAQRVRGRRVASFGVCFLRRLSPQASSAPTSL